MGNGTQLPAMAGLLLVLVAGCVPPQGPTRYYTLSVTARPAAEGTGPDVEIRVGPVTVADYLDRPQLVRRIGAHRLELAENDNWPEPLASHVARVLADDLAAMLPAARIHSSPTASPPERDYRVEIELLAFEGCDDAACLDARWSLVGERDGRILITRRSRIRRPLAAGGTETVVAGLSEAVALLARDIADTIAALHR